MRLSAFILVGFSLLLSCFAWAQSTAPVSIDEAVVEERARIVGRSLRCVVCQNQSIDNSNAPLAADMRLMVRGRIRAGDSNAEVIGFMRERYGDFVLLKPPLQANTIFLWVSPLGLMVIFFLWYALRSRRPQFSKEILPLNDDELAQYKTVTQDARSKQ